MLFAFYFKTKKCVKNMYHIILRHIISCHLLWRPSSAAPGRRRVLDLCWFTQCGVWHFCEPAYIMLQLCRLVYHRHYDGNVIFEVASSRSKQSIAQDYQVHVCSLEKTMSAQCRHIVLPSGWPLTFRTEHWQTAYFCSGERSHRVCFKIFFKVFGLS